MVDGLPNRAIRFPKGSQRVVGFNQRAVFIAPIRKRGRLCNGSDVLAA